MSTSDNITANEQLQLLQILLDGLVQALQEPETPESAPDYLEPVLEECLTAAQDAQLPGIIELLQAWLISISNLAASGTKMEPQTQARMRDWFERLLHCCNGYLEAADRAKLVCDFASMPEMPALQERFWAHLQERLEQAALRIAELQQTDSDVHVSELNNDAPLADSSTSIETADVTWLAPQHEPEILAETPQAFPTVIEEALLMDEEPNTDIGEVLVTDEESEIDSEELLIAAGEPEAGAEAMLITAEEPDTGADEMPAPAEEAETPIWINRDELQLVRETISGQVLPLVPSIDADTDTRQAALADLDFHLTLVGNALEMLGTPTLSAGVQAIQISVAKGEPPTQEALAAWFKTLTDYLEQVDAESAHGLADCAGAIPVLGDAWDSRFMREAARIRIGMDPALAAARKTEALPKDVQLDVAEDVLPNVLEGMLRELPGNAERLGAAVRSLAESGNAAPIDEARRVAHTIKGDANTVGVHGLANLTHVMEDLLVELYKQPEQLQPALADTLEQAADCVEEITDFLLGRGEAPTELLPLYQTLLDWSNTALTDAASAADSHARLNPEFEVHKRDQEAVVPIAPTDTTQTAPERILTVPVALLDELQRLAGESLIMARQIERRLSRLDSFHHEETEEQRLATEILDRLDDLVTLRGAALQSAALRDSDAVDPLEMDQYNELYIVSRRLLESHADSGEHRQDVGALLLELRDLRSQQESAHTELQRAVQRARTVPFKQVSARLQRIVRQTARQLKRPADLQISGQQTRIDAELLDKVVEPLGHLLRNAIDHGLEAPDERILNGKSETGKIRVDVRSAADSIQIRVEDDGRGLDYDAIHNKALAAGLLDVNAAADETTLARMILLPGFSTRDTTTQVSGRGIGMDVVNQRVTDLRGQITLSSVTGQGMSALLRLPVSQAMANVLLVHGYGLILGAVTDSVERVIRFDAEAMHMEPSGDLVLALDDMQLPLYPVEALYRRESGRISLPPAAPGVGIVVTTPSGRRVVISADSVTQVASVVVKPVSPWLPPLPAVRGITLLGDGNLAPVVDVGMLVDTLDAMHIGAMASLLAGGQPQQPGVVVADDSLSVRRALAQLMEDAGYEVAAARDGQEALDLINSTAPGIVLLDLEMPRLNGLEITRYMRSRAETKYIPIVMITSRANEKYRALAEEAGVNCMLSKPYSEDKLVSLVRNLMHEAVTGEAALKSA